MTAALTLSQRQNYTVPTTEAVFSNTAKYTTGIKRDRAVIGLTLVHSDLNVFLVHMSQIQFDNFK